MRIRLILLSLAAFAALIGVSIWATSHVAIVPVLRDLFAQPGVGGHPWFVATLFDAYFGFLWFWAWVAYKETSVVARIVWLVLMFALGNMAMAAYMLLQLRKLPAGAGAEQLLLRRA